MTLAVALLDLLLGYLLADLLSGLYHLAIDRGWGPQRLVAAFEWHHEHPQDLRWTLRPAILGVPVALLTLAGWHPFFWWALGAGISVAELAHWLAHQGVRTLLTLSPEEHARHHADHSQHFCVVSGWCNPALDWVLRRAG